MMRIPDYVPFYTEPDKDKLLETLPNKQLAIKQYRDKNIIPTYDDRLKIFDIVTNYIKKHKLIVYGGHAQNLTIKKYNPTKQFYTDKSEFHDYDIYSPNPILDGINITNEIFSAGYKTVIFREALHYETYSIIYEGLTVCDLSYVPKKIFKNIPKDRIDDLYVCKALFYIIDFLRIFCDPVSSSFRWDKHIERFMLIQETFPVPNINEPLLLDDPRLYPSKPTEYKKSIRKYLKNPDSHLIITSHYAYNKYVSLNNSCKSTSINIKRFNKIKNPIFTVICSSQYKKTIQDIIQYLSKLYNNVTIREKHRFFQFKDISTEIYIENIHVITIYKNNNICVPYVLINNIKYCSFQYNLMFYYIESFYTRIYNEKKPLYNVVEQQYPEYAEHEYHKLAVNILKMRNSYLEAYHITCFDTSPYEDFIILCEGVILSQQQLKQLNDKHYIGFKYIPKNKIVHTYKKNYSNSSGWYVYKKDDNEKNEK